jgi:tRNA U34 5-carboxymethylaminomethyl modifying GTPase MnmE/TrmE
MMKRFLRLKNLPKKMLLRLYSSSKSIDTIFHLSSGLASLSGHFSVGVAIIRVSGPKAKWVLQAMTHRADFVPRLFASSHLYKNSVSQDLLDTGILGVFFQGPSRQEITNNYYLIE